jgi:hypothetical protein
MWVEIPDDWRRRFEWMAYEQDDGTMAIVASAASSEVQRWLDDTKAAPLDVVFECTADVLAFVEVERNGKSVEAGQWIDRGGLKALRLAGGD